MALGYKGNEFVDFVIAQCGAKVRVHDGEKNGEQFGRQKGYKNDLVKTLVWEGKRTRRKVVTVLPETSTCNIKMLNLIASEPCSLVPLSNLFDVTMCKRGFVPPCVGVWLEGSITVVDENVGDWAGSKLETGEYIEYNLSSHSRHSITTSPSLPPLNSVREPKLFSDLSTEPNNPPPSSPPRPPAASYVPPKPNKQPFCARVEYVLHHPNHVSFQSHLGRLSNMERDEVERRLTQEDKWGKNALHRCFWKGELKVCEKVLSLLKSKSLFHLLEVVSTGKGNYGKTPIFYALTQSRSDVVELLVEEGVRVRVVNNKGQTPLSLSVGHVDERVVRIIEDKEKGEGGEWRNFRRDKPDEERVYGDLDPRYGLDELNDPGGKLREIVEKERREGKKVRVVKQTTSSSRKTCNMKVVEGSSTKWWGGGDAKKEKNVNRNVVTKKKTQKKMIASFKSKPNPHPEYPVATLEKLGHDSIVIDTVEGLKCIHLPPGNTNVVIGVDCEWKPATEKGVENPVAVLQIAHSGTAYVVDMIALGLEGPESNEVSDILSTLLKSPRTTIVGFGVQGDLLKLSASFPHMPCFHEIYNVVDIAPLARIANSGESPSDLTSLSKTTQVELKMNLNKGQQMSIWDKRPLTGPQVEYAAIDAAVCVRLYESMREKVENFDDFLTSPRGGWLKSNFRFTLIGSNSAEDISSTASPSDFLCPTAWGWKTPGGTAKTSLGKMLATQQWESRNVEIPGVPTFDPELYKIREAREAERERQRENSRKLAEERKARRRKSEEAGRKGKRVQLKDVFVSQGHGLKVGGPCGFTKREVIENLVNPDGEYGGSIVYNLRSGVIEIADATLLFVNLGGGRHKKYRNDVLEGGRKITFDWGGMGRVEEEGSGGEKKILFFARFEKEDFVYLGKACECGVRLGKNGQESVVLEFTSYDKMEETEKMRWEQVCQLHQEALGE